MDWKLYDIDGKFIQEVNCEYDSLDFAHYNNAVKVTIDFENQEARIVSKR